MLLRRGATKDKFSVFADNKGNEYDYKWVAQVASFYNLIMGCFKNGFPVVVPRLIYDAWAFYPFFFVRRDIKVKDPISELNHERIHIRQQRDIHLTVSLPVLFIIPFIPTIFYGLEMLRSWRSMVLDNERYPNEPQRKITFRTVRENTCFERESISRATNAKYLYHRKFWAVLAYTGWKPFLKYGMDK